MGIIDTTKISDLEYNLSCVATAKLTEAIKNQLLKLPVDFDEQAKTDKQRAKLLRAEYYSGVHAEVAAQMTQVEKRTNEIVMEKGASSWLTTITLTDFDFHLSKRVLGCHKSPI